MKTDDQNIISVNTGIKKHGVSQYFYGNKKAIVYLYSVVN